MAAVERRWRPRPVADGYLGFCLSGVRAAYDEACKRLELRQLGRPKPGYVGRNAGGMVRTRDGTVLWLKVGGVYTRNNRFFLGELDAGTLDGLPKPALIANLEWSRDLVTWGARLMTFVAEPVIERDPWAGNRAGRVGDAWLDRLKAALRTLAARPTERIVCDPREVRRVIEERYGADAPPLAAWLPSHGDLHWNNLTGPDMSLLDWEVWGLAPPGYDAAMLIAYSAKDAALVARLEATFADVLSSRAAQATRLFVLDQFLRSIEGGWLDPRLRDPVRDLTAAAGRRWREGG